MRTSGAWRESRDSFGRNSRQSMLLEGVLGGAGGGKKKVTDVYTNDEVFFSLLTVSDAFEKARMIREGGAEGGGQEGGRCGRFDTKVAAVVYLSAFVGFVVTVAAGYFCLYEHEDEQGNL